MLLKLLLIYLSHRTLWYNSLLAFLSVRISATCCDQSPFESFYYCCAVFQLTFLIIYPIDRFSKLILCVAALTCIVHRALLPLSCLLFLFYIIVHCVLMVISSCFVRFRFCVSSLFIFVPSK